MPEPSVTATAIQSHTAALSGAIHRHSANAGRCKVWSVGIMVGVVFFGVGRAQWATLPWVAGAVALLALADACCVVLVRRAVEAYNRFMARVPLNGGPSTKAQAREPEEWLVLPGADLGIREAGSVLRALGSFSVWPFYGGLLALVVAFHVQTSRSGEGSARLLPSAATKSKPLPATHLLSAPTPRPAQPGTIGAPSPGPGTRPGIRPAGSTAQPGGTVPIGTQPGPKIVQPGQPGTSGQPPMFSPQKPGQTPPTARIPALPPRPPQPVTPPNSLPTKPPAPTGTGTPQTAVPPPNAVPPQNAASPQTGSPLQNGVPPPNAAPSPAPAGGTPALPPAAAPAAVPTVK